jgi:hypothetical protein
MDPGRPKSQSYRNRTKPTPLRWDRRVDFSHVIFSANGHCMRKISRSDRFPKQEKKSTGQSQQTILLTSIVQQVTSTIWTVDFDFDFFSSLTWTSDHNNFSIQNPFLEKNILSESERRALHNDVGFVWIQELWIFGFSGSIWITPPH